MGNLKDDYNLFKARAAQSKQNDLVNEWVEEKIKTTYIKISDKYRSCPFAMHGWLKN